MDDEVRLVYRADTTGLDNASRSAQALRRHTDDLRGATDKAGRASRDWGTIVYQASQAVQDAQYGLQGAINNISFLAQMMGAGGAMGVGIQVGLAGVAALMHNWGALSGMMGLNAGPAIRSVEDRIGALSRGVEELNKNLSKTPDELNELRRAQAELDRANAAATAGGKVADEASPEQKAARAGLAGAVEKGFGGRGGAIVRALVDAQEKAGTLGTAQDQANLKAFGIIAENRGGQFDARRQQEAVGQAQTLRARLRDEATQAATQQVGAAMTDPRAGADLQNRLRQIGQGDIAARMAEAMVPADDAEFRRKAGEQLQKAAKTIGEEARKVFGAAGVRQEPADREAMAKQMGDRMDALGVAPEMQSRIAGLFAGKAGMSRLAQLPQILQMMQAGGANQREMMEALPGIFGGGNVLRNTQRALNDIQAGGLRLGVAAGRMGPEWQQAMAGAAMLGLGPPGGLLNQAAAARRGRRRRAPGARRRAGPMAALNPQQVAERLKANQARAAIRGQAMNRLGGLDAVKRQAAAMLGGIAGEAMEPAWLIQQRKIKAGLAQPDELPDVVAERARQENAARRQGFGEGLEFQLKRNADALDEANRKGVPMVVRDGAR
jgi:hypothetical protein